MESVYWKILSSIRDQLRTQVAFAGLQDIPGIPKENIIIRMPPPYARRKDGMDVLNPGIVITPGRQIMTESSGGMWSLDDIRYPVLVQLVDAEFSTYNESRMRCWLKWLEQVRKYLCHGNLKLAVMEDSGYVDIVYCPSTNVLDEGQFYLHADCVGLIALVCESREQRDPLGTN